MNLSRSNVSILYVVIIVTLLALVGISSYVASTNMGNELNVVVNEAIPLSQVSQSIMEDMINQETSVRGFYVTGDDKFLEPYEQGKQRLVEDLAVIANYQKKYPNLKSLMEGDVIPQIQRVQDFYASQIALVRSGNIDEVKNRITMGRNMMDRFRQMHLKVSTEIGTITDGSYKNAKDAGKTARAVIAMGGALALVAGLMSAFIFNRANQAETKLRNSEESYRYMAESLESQNEEIIAQQEEQERTLEKLSLREQELESISAYQEKLTGSVEMEQFLHSSLPALLDSLKMDAALLVMREHSNADNSSSQDNPSYNIVHSIGYPQQLPTTTETALFGPALRIFTEKQPIECRRDLSGPEQGIHQSVKRALDQYYPLLDDNQEVIGFLMLTSYLTARSEQRTRVAKGLARQFSMAFLAQLTNEERRSQATRLKQLNQQLLQEKLLIQEQRDLIENILESTHEGMMLCDSKGTLQFANHRMGDYLPLDGHIGASWKQLGTIVEQSNMSFMPIYLSIEGLLNGSLDKLTERFVFTDNDNQQRHLELYATKVGDKENKADSGYLFVFRDRTEEERVDEMKNEFISIVSHELRTPLASVLGFIEILLHREISADKQQKYMETIYKEATRLSTLINDFLDLQRMESGSQVYHFAPLDLVSLMEEVADQWRDKHGHRINIDVPKEEVWIRADADRFKQIAHNLLSNAVKYSPDADRVDVLITRDGDEVKLQVTDYGLGIPEEAKGKLFSKFYRVDNTDRRQIGGTGLGLAIVKEIVDAHQGTILFASEMGKGTTFTVGMKSYILPNADGTIIVLEDDDNLAKLIQIALAKLQIPSVHLRSAEEGIIALQQIQNNPPRLCIVDIHLEGTKTGWDFMAELYRHPRFHRTPVVVSTALEQPLDYHGKDIEKFMRKPFSMERLLQVVEQLLNSTEDSTAYIFPAQDESTIKTSLAKNGIRFTKISRDEDTIQFELKPAAPTAEDINQNLDKKSF